MVASPTIFNIDPVLIRLVWIFFTLFGGSGILAYIIAMIIIPNEGEVTGMQPESEPPKKTTTKSFSSNVVWGAVLIVIGIILIVQHMPVFRMMWHSFFGAGINVVFGVAILGVGIYLLLSRSAKTTDDGRIPLHISSTNKQILGVCGGIAEALHVDVTIVRFLWVFGTFMSVGLGVLLYFALALFLDKSSESRDDTEPSTE